VGDLGLVGGEVNGEKRGPVPGVTTGEELSQPNELEKEAFLDKDSEVGVVTGKHDWQEIGESCVQRMVVGPWISQKWASDT